MKIIISVALAFFLVACSEDKTSSSSNQDIFKEATKIVEPVADTTEKVVEKVQESIPEVSQVEIEPAVVMLEETTEVVTTKSGADLFKVCSSCHGVNGEKKALNKSQVIQAWSESQVSAALHGYKDGSYGGAMKGLMKSQVGKLSDEDISALAKHISEL